MATKKPEDLGTAEGAVQPQPLPKPPEPPDPADNVTALREHLTKIQRLVSEAGTPFPVQQEILTQLQIAQNLLEGLAAEI